MGGAGRGPDRETQDPWRTGREYMFFKILFSNIIGYDGIIFLLAAGQAALFYLTWMAITKIYVYMHPSDYVPSHSLLEEESMESMPTEQALVQDLENRTFWYTAYGNLTAIFPLMGILGTVSSLIGMVGDMANFQGSFYMALTSTFWGLIFAIASKIGDSWLSSRLEDDERAVALYLQRKTGRGPKKK